MHQPEGALLGEWGGPGSGPGQFYYPSGVAVARDGAIYVADSEYDFESDWWYEVVLRFDREGDFSGRWYLVRAMGVAVAADDTMYVTYHSGGVRFEPA